MSGPRFLFDGFTLDPEVPTLTRGGDLVDLQQKPLTLLATLAAAGGEVVTREALFEAVWPGVFVSEASLDQAVRKARKALGAVGGDAAIISTVTGRGYRLGVPVQQERERPPAAAGNLGAPLDELVGRAAERERVLAWLREGRLVTLAGLGGVGKTTLSLACARALAPELPGGAWLVEAEAVTDADGLRSATADTLGVALGDGGDDRLGAALAARGPLLLVLDNLEQVREPGPAVLAWLRAAPELRVLATSRGRLMVRPERVLELGPLPAEDGAALFRRRAGVEDEQAALEALCEAVDGVPLAIELLAAQRVLMAVQDLAESVRAGLGALPNLNADAPARHASLSAALDWSWSLLDAAARDALSDLGVFSRAFTLPRAVALLGPAGASRLAELRRASLVSMGEGGALRLPAPVREYAREKLAASGRAAGAYDRLRAQLAEAARGFRRRPLAALAPLREDLWEVAARPGDAAADLACAELLLYLDGKRVRWERLAVVRRRLEAIAAAEPTLAGRALGLLARSASDHQRPDEAAAAVARALEAGGGEAHMAAGVVDGRAGRHAESLAHFAAAAAAFEAAGAPGGAARARASAATTLIRRGEDTEAAPELEEAVASLRALGAGDTAMPFAVNLVIALGNLGRVRERAALLGELRGWLDRHPDPYWEPIVDYERGRHAAGEGALRVAEGVLEGVLAAMERDATPTWYCAWALGLVHARRGREDRARRLLERACREAAAAGPLAEADALRAHTIGLRLLGDDRAALAHARASIATLDAHGQRHGAADVRCWAALCCLHRGDREASLAFSLRAAADSSNPRIARLLIRAAEGTPPAAAELAALRGLAHDEDKLLVEQLAALGVERGPLGA